MKPRQYVICTIIASALAVSACATSPDAERKRQEMEADIDDILSYELDPAEYGEPRTCLNETDTRGYEALGDRHILFRGRQGRLWVNALRARCLGLGKDGIFVIEPTAGRRYCAMDRFSVVDRASALGAVAAPNCTLGEFKPVTEAQVEEIRNRLEMR